MLAVLPIAERLIAAQAATAEANGRTAGEIILRTLGIDDFKISFDANRSMIKNCDFG